MLIFIAYFLQILISSLMFAASLMKGGLKPAKHQK